MDKDQYINKILEEHLNNRNTYRISEFDPTPHITHDTKILINFLHSKHHINDHTAKYLKPHDPPCTPIFYGLPKIHKVNNPLRPLSLALMVPPTTFPATLPIIYSHLLNTYTHKKHKTYAHYPRFIRPTTFQYYHGYCRRHLVIYQHTSWGWTGSHLPTLQTISAPASLKCTSPFCHQILLEHVLKHSNFRFLNSHYIQNNGTSIGGRYAPQYANLFMADVEAAILMEFQQYIPLWKRFIDDVFFLFIGSDEDLNRLKQFMNIIHDTIKFTFEHSKERINFLDLSILSLTISSTLLYTENPRTAPNSFTFNQITPYMSKKELYTHKDYDTTS
ncbi:uncharacterized protein [Clytia hemisphaerica]|uniref:uncharacterized protein n=1 Tax=Clytia hemisphaerica TaxID=252671 RepID=UPI0034D5B4CA